MAPLLCAPDRGQLSLWLALVAIVCGGCFGVANGGLLMTAGNPFTQPSSTEMDVMGWINVSRPPFIPLPDTADAVIMAMALRALGENVGENAADLITVAYHPDAATVGQPFLVQPVIVAFSLNRSVVSPGTLITPSIAHNFANGVLSGSAVRTSEHGVARFTDLAISGAPGVYALQFSADTAEGLVQGDSMNFVVHSAEDVCGNERKKLITFSIYSPTQTGPAGDLYTHGAVENCRMVEAYYPGWRARFYVDALQPAELLAQLRAECDAEIVHIPASHPLGNASLYGMFWRFLAADDADVDRFIVRDVDSRFTAREVMCVQEWCGSGKAFHGMRDHLWHDHHINGGMWGAKRGFLKGPTLESLVLQYIESMGGPWAPNATFDKDMDFLAKYVWRIVEDGDQLSHDSSTCLDWEDSLPYPIPRTCIRPMECHCVGLKYYPDGSNRGDCDFWLHAETHCRRRAEWTKG